MNYDRLTERAWSEKQFKDEKHYGNVSREAKVMKLWKMIPQFSKMDQRDKARFIQKCRFELLDAEGDARLTGILEHISIKCEFNYKVWQ